MNLPGSEGEHILQEKYRTQDRAQAFYTQQVLDYLNLPMQEFVGAQSMVFIATADSKGECDCSIRTGLPGFVQILDAQTLLYPEYRGNGVLASLGNILENPHIGMVFVDFFRTTRGLHVNGYADIKSNEEVVHILEEAGKGAAGLQHPAGKTPERWVIVRVEEAYIHCSKNIPHLQLVEAPEERNIDSEQDSRFFREKPSGKSGA